MSTVVTELWSKSKLVFKVFIIGFIILLLLIPMNSVEDLVVERESRQKEAVNEVSSKWASAQTINGPMLVVPYWQTMKDAYNKISVEKKHAFFLPADVQLTASLQPREKHRGIYKVMLYSSGIDMKATFHQPDYAALKIRAEDMLWNEAFVSINLSDMKGLNDQIVGKWNDSVLSFAAKDIGATGHALTAPIDLAGKSTTKAIFHAKLALNGSQELKFTPVGRNTRVTMTSTYQHPSFTGDILPQESSVGKQGFSAVWKSNAKRFLQPQQFKETDRNDTRIVDANASSFGVSLFVPVNAYQKTLRSVKYAVLCIVLTFAAFFLIEMVHKLSVHPFQYGLIGIALVLFYSLLLSFSEYLGFNISYLIASAATIALISWFVKGVLGSGKLSTILSSVLVLMYAYLFTILQLQDFALLLGSIGLFLTLAVIMHFSKKIQW